MLFFYKHEDIKNCPMAVIVPPTGTRTLDTLDAIKSDIGDYHLDYRRWWEQGNNKSPIPTVPPRFGKAYPRLHVVIAKTVFRQIITDHTLLVNANPDAVIVSPDNNPSGWPAGTVGAYFPEIGAEGYARLSLTPIDGGGAAPPAPSGSHVVYWRTNHGLGHFDVGDGTFQIDQLAGYNYGTVTISEAAYNMLASPGFQTTVLRDEFISDHKIARLNYLSFLDSKILRTSSPDPSPISEPLWRGVWDADSTYSFGEIVTRNSKTYFSLRNKNLNRDPELAKLLWERCNRPRAQIVAGCGVGNPISVSQARAEPVGATGLQTYLFPDRTYIRPVCSRPFPNGGLRNWKESADVFGIEVDAPTGFGRLGHLVNTPGFEAGGKVSFLTDFGTRDLWNGITNNIVNQEYVVIGTDGYVNFVDQVDTYSVTEQASVSLTEEPAP